MLLPISAASSASVDYQTTGRQVVRPPEGNTPGTSAPTTALPANVLSGGRIDVLSLFSQLNLAQGLSVFAETVGSYLKISRREGETLVDYAHRLAEAVKSLSPSQRLILEQSLAQLVRGITLRTLMEVLNNPLGPEAARLAAYMETAQLTERDPAARAVVSSYRQNGGAELALAPTTKRLPAVAGEAAHATPTPRGSSPNKGAPAGGGSAGERAMSGLPRPVDAAPPRSALAGGGADRTAGVPEGSRSRAFRAQERSLANLGGSLPAKQAEEIASSRASPSAATVSTIPRGDTAETDTIGASRSGKGSVIEGPSRGEPMPAANPGPGAPVTHEGAPLARVAQRVVGEPAHKFLQEVLYQTASAPASSPAEATPSRHQGSQAPPSLTPTPEPDATPPVLRSDVTEVTNRQASPAAAGTADPDQVALQTAGGPAKAVATPSLAPSLPDPSTFIFAAPMLAREGFAQAFVAYPHVPPPPPEEERDVERVTAVDEDGGRRQSQQDAQGEREHEQDEQSDEDDAGDGSDEDRADHAQDLYWRMADLT